MTEAKLIAKLKSYGVEVTPPPAQENESRAEWCEWLQKQLGWIELGISIGNRKAKE